MTFCTKCGTQLADDVSFCSKCGTPVKAASQALNVSFSNETNKKSIKQIDDGGGTIAASAKGETHIVPYKNIEIYIARQGAGIKVEHINAFIKTTEKVFKELELMNIKAEIGKLYIRNMANPTAIMDIAVLAELAGDFEYRVLFEMSRETALDLAGAMNGEKFTDFNKIAKDTILELVNIITSQSRNFGLNVKPSNIELFTDSNINLATTLDPDSIMVIPIKFE
jgi:chemotaxis protein CheX